MKVKVSELAGYALDYWVAQACGIKVRITPLNKNGPICRYEISGCVYAPSTEWGQGGPIIERARIIIGPSSEAPWRAQFNDGGHIGGKIVTIEHGPTPLIAAMRAFVASRFGEEVEVPA